MAMAKTPSLNASTRDLSHRYAVNLPPAEQISDVAHSPRHGRGAIHHGRLLGWPPVRRRIYACSEMASSASGARALVRLLGSGVAGRRKAATRPIRAKTPSAIMANP